MPYPQTGGGSGSGFTVGPPLNLFGATAGDVSTNPLVVLPASDKATAEGVRDAYFTSNPANLAVYDLSGNESLGVFIYYTDGGELVTTGQTRVGGEWRDSASTIGIQGLPGSGTDFSGISDNHIPAVGSSPDKIPFDSGLVVMPDGTIATTGSLRAGTNTLELDLAHSISSTGENVTFRNEGSGVDFYPVWQTYALGRDGANMRLRAGNHADSNNPYLLPINTVDNGALTNPSWSAVVPVLAGEDGQAALYADAIVDATSVLTNVQLELQIDGVIFSRFMQDLTVGTYRFNFEPNFDFRVGQTLTFTLSSVDGDVVMRGETVSGVPVINQFVYTWTEEPIGLMADSDLSNKSVTELNDVTNAGSGKIITDLERDLLSGLAGAINNSNGYGLYYDSSTEPSPQSFSDGVTQQLINDKSTTEENLPNLVAEFFNSTSNLFLPDQVGGIYGFKISFIADAASRDKLVQIAVYSPDAISAGVDLMMERRTNRLSKTDNTENYISIYFAWAMTANIITNGVKVDLTFEGTDAGVHDVVFQLDKLNAPLL